AGAPPSPTTLREFKMSRAMVLVIEAMSRPSMPIPWTCPRAPIGMSVTGLPESRFGCEAHPASNSAMTAQESLFMRDGPSVLTGRLDVFYLERRPQEGTE